MLRVASNFDHGASASSSLHDTFTAILNALSNGLSAQSPLNGEEIEQQLHLATSTLENFFKFSHTLGVELNTEIQSNKALLSKDNARVQQDLTELDEILKAINAARPKPLSLD